MKKQKNLTQTWGAVKSFDPRVSDLTSVYDFFPAKENPSF
jgi:hypothetical protein